jgi:hypothetical protein
VTTEPTARKHNPAWRDGTRNERQRRRQAALDEAAQAAGYETWRRLETAVVNGASIRIDAPPEDTTA